MKANMGILPELPQRVRGKHDRYAAYAARAKAELDIYLDGVSFQTIDQAVSTGNVLTN